LNRAGDERQFMKIINQTIELLIESGLGIYNITPHIAILAGVINFLPHPSPPRTQGEGVRNSQMI